MKPKLKYKPSKKPLLYFRLGEGDLTKYIQAWILVRWIEGALHDGATVVLPQGLCARHAGIVDALLDRMMPELQKLNYLQGRIESV